MFGRLFGLRRVPPEQAFWEWFAANAEGYRSFELNGPEQARLLQELDKHLGRVQRGLCYQFGGDDEQQRREFVISADGHRDLFPAVQRLVGAAPADLPGFRVVAFRPRLPNLDAIRLEFGDVSFSPSDLWFALRAEGDQIGVALFPKGFEDVRSEAALTACFLMLDSALGEYDVETKVGTIMTYPLPDNPEEQGLTNFQHFPEAFEARYKIIYGEALHK